MHTRIHIIINCIYWAVSCFCLSFLLDLVRDIKILPEKEKFRVGDELKCSAKGNPTPRISLLPKNVQARTGPGWQSLIIGQNWEGQRVMVQCTARNTIGSETETLSSNLTIHVTGLCFQVLSFVFHS